MKVDELARLIRIGDGTAEKFIRDIISKLLECANGHPPRSINRLVRAIWKKLSSKWENDFSSRDCKNILTLLKEKADIFLSKDGSKRKNNEPFCHFTLNPHSTFLASIESNL